MAEACVLLIRLVARQSCGRPDHLHKSDDRAEDYSREIKPVCMQPVVEQPADRVAEKDRRRDDETDLRVASRGNQGVRLRWAIWIFGILVFGHGQSDSTPGGRGVECAGLRSGQVLAWTGECARLSMSCVSFFVSSGSALLPRGSARSPETSSPVG